jgi:putative solute:sodium symporter small subunit
MFGSNINSATFLGYPLAYYMTAQGSLLSFVILIFWAAGRQENIDEEFGYGEREGN